MKKTDRKTVYGSGITFVIMFLPPLLIARVASECSGMILCMALFLIVNPIYSVALGILCGRDVRRMWSLPLVSSVAFLAGTLLFLDITEIWFLAYAAVYLALGWGAMLLTRYITNRNN